MRFDDAWSSCSGCCSFSGKGNWAFSERAIDKYLGHFSILIEHQLPILLYLAFEPIQLCYFFSKVVFL